MSKQEITLFTNRSSKGDMVQIPTKGYARIEASGPGNANCHGMRYNEKRTSGVGFTILPCSPLSVKEGEWLMFRDAKNMERIFFEIR